MREWNYQTSFIIWSHLSPTGEHTCFAGTATVNRSPHQHSCRRWLEVPAGSSMKKLAATSVRRHWPICCCCLDRWPRSFDVKDATTLSWSSAAVSEWVSESECSTQYTLVTKSNLTRSFLSTRIKQSRQNVERMLDIRATKFTRFRQSQPSWVCSTLLNLTLSPVCTDEQQSQNDVTRG